MTLWHTYMYVMVDNSNLMILSAEELSISHNASLSQRLIVNQQKNDDNDDDDNDIDNDMLSSSSGCYCYDETFEENNDENGTNVNMDFDEAMDYLFVEMCE